MEGMGEEKLYFPLLKSRKRHKAPLGRTVSTHFVADCSFSLVAFSFDSKLLLPNCNKHMCVFFLFRYMFNLFVGEVVAASPSFNSL